MNIDHLNPDSQENEAAKRDELARKIKSYIAVCAFDALDDLLGKSFIDWFTDQHRSGNYANELVNCLLRTPFWQTNDAVELSYDFADHLIKMELLK